MIAKITSGSSFGGALDYQMKPKEQKQKEEKERYQEKLKDAQCTPGEPAPPFEAGERHRVIGGNMSGQTKAELTREFEAISRQRPDIEKPVHHSSLRAGKNDKITVEQWQEIAARYVEEMGFKGAPYVVIQHRDTPEDHIHILTSRVDIRGNVISDWKCKERAQEVLRGIEKDYGLEQVKSSREVARAAPKRGEIERFNRTGELSVKMALQGDVEHALKGTPAVTEFIEKLQLVNVDVIPYVGKDGRATGISFRKGKQLMKGSDLGRGFSWNALQERGLDYHQGRDRTAIEAARLRADMTRELINEAPAITTPAPGNGVMDFVEDAGRAAGNYVLDQVNPIQQLQNQVQVIQQASQTLMEGYSLVKDLFTRDNSIENLQRAAGLEPSGQDPLARLHEATRLEPSTDDHDALDRLNKSAGIDRETLPANPSPALEQALEHAPEAMPALEMEVAEHTIEPAIELLF
jgi:hypothetical protein